MSVIVAIGAPETIEGFALAGVRVIPAVSAAEARAAWAARPADTGLAILTPDVRAALADVLRRSGALHVELPS